MVTTILLIDDHPVFRKGLLSLLEEEEDLSVVGEAGDGREAIERARELSPDVVVMDITMPKLNGVEATRHILSASPDTKVVALSIHSGKQFVEDMLRAGAIGYILKESAPEDLVKGIRTVIRGEVYLSPAITGVVVSHLMNVISQTDVSADQAELTAREREIAMRIAEGSPPEKIADALGIKTETVESTRRRIMKKLGVESVAELAGVARERRWLEDSGQTTAGGTAPSMILRTKLHRPPVPRDLVSRTQILEGLTPFENKPFTLISAPAGYGKSTLASSWLETCGCPNAWFSIDEDDNDLRRFLSYFLSAVQTLFPEAGKETKDLLNAPVLPPSSVLTETLLNDLDRIVEGFILVLDEYQYIRENTVHDLLAALLSHPPKAMHLALLTRCDPPLPLSKLRGQGQMNEIGARHLRFSPSETAVFLKNARNLSIDEATATVIDEKVEGWPVGLRLVVHSLEDSRDLDRIVKGLQGGFSSILDYLVAEVLSRQKPYVSDYLLKTAIVDRFCAPLCDVLSAPDIAPEVGVIKGADFITWLQANNLFIIALDAENRWFRYHRLFQQLLQNQLKDRFSLKEIRALHSRASNWFEKNGLIYEALQHALAGEAWENAVQMVEGNRHSMLENDQWYVVEKWLSLFPETVIRQQPELLMALAWKLYHQFDISAIPPVIDAVESLLDDKPDKVPLHGEIDFFRGYLCYFQNKGARSLKYLREARKKVPETYLEVRGQIEILHALASQMQGQKKEALGTIQDLLQHQKPAQDVDRTRLLVTPVYINIISGDLEEAISANQQLYNFSARHGYEYARVWSVYLRGLIRFYQNDLNAAVDDFRLAIEKKYILHTRATVDGMAGLAYAYHASGQPDQVDATIQLLTDYADSLDDPNCSLIARSCKARMSILQGKPALVERWFGGSPPPIENMVWWLEIPSVTHCRALYAEGSEKSLTQAEARLEELLKLNQDNHNTCHQIQMMSLLALVYKKQGRTDEALEILEEAVSLSKPGGWIRPFIEAGPLMEDLLKRLKGERAAVDYIEHLLSMFKREESGTAPKASRHQVERPLAEETPASIPLLLSQRELEILSLVAKGQSNKEIAASLHISTETVKKHLYNTYQKLEVDNRISAMARARELNILPHN